MMVRCPYDLHYHEGSLPLVVEGMEGCRDSYFGLYGQLHHLGLPAKYMSHVDIVALALGALNASS